MGRGTRAAGAPVGRVSREWAATTGVMLFFVVPHGQLIHRHVTHLT